MGAGEAFLGIQNLFCQHLSFLNLVMRFPSSFSSLPLLSYLLLLFLFLLIIFLLLLHILLLLLFYSSSSSSFSSSIISSLPPPLPIPPLSPPPLPTPLPLIPSPLPPNHCLWSFGGKNKTSGQIDLNSGRTDRESR